MADPDDGARRARDPLRQGVRRVPAEPLDLGPVVGPHGQDPETVLDRVLAAAEDREAVLLDEADALTSRRGEVRGAPLAAGEDPPA